MKTHRDEKQARAATAAIRVETLAAEAAQDLAGATGESKPEGHYETDAASYENGEVTLKINPLKTTHDILCPRCHLPRLLYPTDGRGARKPDPSLSYCKKHPYIDKPGCDIYGQMWVAPGPGRGKKKKDFDKKVSAAIHAATTDIENGNGTTTEQRPPNVLSFPSATCSKCKRCILVSRLNNHMGSCIGNSGRNASRAAAAKISNGGNGNSNSMNDHTPPSSQKGTPLPSSQGSPRKRDADDFDEDGFEDSDMTGASGSQSTTKPKKKFKSSASASLNGTGGTNTPSGSSSQGLSVSLSKKLTLKMKGSAGNLKKQKQKATSALSFERKINDNYDDDDEDDENHDEEDNDNSRDYVDDGGDDDDDGDEEDDERARNGRDSMFDDDDDDDGDARGHMHFKTPNHGSVGNGQKRKKKQQKLIVASTTSTPPKKATKVPIPLPSKKVKLISKGTPLAPPGSKNGRIQDIDMLSESSETMSSPRG